MLDYNRTLVVNRISTDFEEKLGKPYEKLCNVVNFAKITKYILRGFSLVSAVFLGCYTTFTFKDHFVGNDTDPFPFILVLTVFDMLYVVSVFKLSEILEKKIVSIYSEKHGDVVKRVINYGLIKRLHSDFVNNKIDITYYSDDYLEGFYKKDNNSQTKVGIPVKCSKRTGDKDTIIFNDDGLEFILTEETEYRFSLSNREIKRKGA